MVRQLLTVSRLDSGVPAPGGRGLRARPARAPRLGGAGGGLGRGTGAGAVPFELVDEAGGWLAVADPDQVDQVLWALLDNAVKYGGGAPVTARVARRRGGRAGAADDRRRRPRGRAEDRERLFARYARGGASDDRDGTGLGLYVGRALARANGGDLVLEAGRVERRSP